MAAPATQLLDRALFDALLERARNSPRRRTNHNFHVSHDEHANRFLNAMLEGTYIAPHRHLDPPKPESFLVLEGEIAFFTFDDEGNILEARRLGADPMGIDIQPGIWHTAAVLSPHAICFEVKPGPYSPLTDKEFAPWAPREGDPRVPAYLEKLLAGVVRRK